MSKSAASIDASMQGDFRLSGKANIKFQTLIVYLLSNNSNRQGYLGVLCSLENYLIWRMIYDSSTQLSVLNE